MRVLDSFTSYDSVSAYGTATGPIAAAAISTIAAGSLPAGYYKIQVGVRIDGTLATADRDNFIIKAGATTIRQILCSDVADSGNIINVEMYRTLDGSTALTVNALGAATATAVMSATITATRVA